MGSDYGHGNVQVRVHALCEAAGAFLFQSFLRKAGAGWAAVLPYPDPHSCDRAVTSHL